VINPQLVSDSLVFSRKKMENAKMATVVSDVFGHLIVGLSERDNAAVSVPPIDKKSMILFWLLSQTRSSKTTIF